MTRTLSTTSFGRVLTAVPAVLALAALSACGGSSAAAGDGDDSTVTIAVDDGQEPHWQLIRDLVAEEGIDLEVESFTDGPQINSATQNGDVDLNLFQHIAFLAQFNVNSNGDLVPVGATAVYPLALYSTEHPTLEDLPADAEIAIPSNPTNQARALLNLQDAGLLTLVDGGNSLSTPAEIESGDLTITTVDTNQTVNALNGSADASVVNNTQAARGGLGDEDIIYKDDLDSGTNDPYINVFVAKEGNADDPRFQTIIDAYHSPEVQEAVSDLNNGNLEFKQDWTAEELQELLASEEDVAASGEGTSD